MPGRRKIIKKLYTRLKECQAFDLPLPAPSVVEIKFYLKNHPRCVQIIIEDDSPSEDTVIEQPTVASQFLLSQLESQKVTDLSRLPIQASAVLAFATAYCAKTPTKSSFPTLFLWHSQDKQRTYYLFAYLIRSMESRSYTVDELLQLRGGQTSQALLKKLKSNPEISDVVKSKGNMPPAQSRRLKKPKEDISSSTDSEEILFQGKKQARSENSDVQWKYRGRSGSEATVNEPLPAPTGLVAQQSEGFQRFFKAVVSPTHVRVTAGGRIVPNTRGSASPTAKADNDRAGLEGQDSTESTKNADSENGVGNGTGNGTGTDSQAPPPMVPPMLPGHVAYIQHMQMQQMQQMHQLGMAMPLYPMHNGFPMGYGIPPPQASLPNTSQPPSVGGQQSAGAAPAAEKAEDAANKKPRPAPIKISPPEQFDQNRPFFYNGHVIYPAMGAGQAPPPAMFPSPYYPHGMMTHPGFAAPHMAQMPPPASVAPMPNSAGLPPTSFGPPSSAGGVARAPQPRSAPSSAITPPITSIKPSEITKRQLDTLRGSLKYLEGQLQYNKHQIDEKWTNAQVRGLKDKIAQFEHTYKSQSAYEASCYQGFGQGSAGEVDPCQTPSRASSIRENSRSGSIRSGSGTHSLRRFQSIDHVGGQAYMRRNKKAIGINSSKVGGSGSSAAFEALEAHVFRKLQMEQLQKRQELQASEAAEETAAEAAGPVKKPSLPSGAALAPPFNPGSASSVHLQTPTLNEHTSSSSLVASGESQGKSQAGLSAAYNPSQWQSSGLLPQSQRATWDTMQSGSTYSTTGSTAGDAQTSTEQLGQSSFTPPYLVGRLPHGLNPYTARGVDYVYSRELTDEEKRARHVYWGQVSNKGLGLPKFDGKDFYPPSPVKATDKTELSSKAKDDEIPSGRLEADYKTQLRSSENDPFCSSRDAESVRSHESGQKLSKAIPIVAPNDSRPRGAPKAPKAPQAPKAPTHASTFASQTGGSADELAKVLKDCKIAPTKPAAESGSDKKASSLSRRALERSSNKSGHDLLQTMLRKGSTSGNALPSAVSSTTATGYLPQYFGHASASLGPAISNTNTSPARDSHHIGSKPIDLDGTQLPADKIGENCPPGEAPSADYDATKDLHERMLRDAERRGVIGSDWQ